MSKRGNYTKGNSEGLKPPYITQFITFLASPNNTFRADKYLGHI